jgi:hypothetical protein
MPKTKKPKATDATRMTFAQREAGAPLPQQMKRDEVTRRLRVRLYSFLRSTIIGAGGIQHSWDDVEGAWDDIFWSLHTDFLENMPDTYSSTFSRVDAAVKQIFENGDYALLFGALEHILRHESCPGGLASQIQHILEETQAAYRIVDHDTFVPFTSEGELATVVAASGDLGDSRFVGAKAHYKAAMEALTGGDYAGSMRESIHALESLTKLLTGKKTLQDGVVELVKGKQLHTTVGAALEKVAAWTNAVAGIRHAKDAANANPSVNEADAVYLLALAGATMSYLRRVGENTGLIK